MPSPAPGASFLPLILHPAGPASYTASDPHALAAFLAQRGWVRLPGRAACEVARLTLGRQIIVLFANSTALVQGVAQERTHGVLRELVEAQ